MNETRCFSEVTGTINATIRFDDFRNFTKSDLSCAVPGPDQYSLCQLGATVPGYIGSLQSQFENSSSYGAAFLVIKGTSKSDVQTEGIEWLHVPITNDADKRISFSLCSAPWDAAVLDIELLSKANRTEPQLQWWETFQTSEVLSRLLPGPSDSRQILDMAKPRSYLGDLPPRLERPLVQSDASGSSAAEYGNNSPLAKDWSIFLTGKPMITVLNDFTKAPTRAIAADPALAAIFSDTMAKTRSVSTALSSLITVLSMNNYYSQQPAFDRLDSARVSFFVDVLYPQSTTGLMIVLWTLLVHLALVCVLVVTFVRTTKYTLLGDAWSAFSQMAESNDVQEHFKDGTLKTDSDVQRNLKQRDRAGLRARLVGREDKAEIAIQ
jgi:hypothetical protein